MLTKCTNHTNRSNDTFILAFEAVFSLMAGYISVLVYEYAARGSASRAGRARAASTLNMGFQVGTSGVTVCGVSSYYWSILYYHCYCSELPIVLPVLPGIHAQMAAFTAVVMSVAISTSLTISQ